MVQEHKVQKHNQEDDNLKICFRRLVVEEEHPCHGSQDTPYQREEEDCELAHP